MAGRVATRRADSPSKSRKLTEAEHLIRQRYRLGCELLKIRKKGGEKAKAIVRTVAEEQGITQDLVWKAIAFAECYDRADLEQLCRLRAPSGRSLTFSHVRRLLAVKDKRQRARLQEQAAKEGWSERVLAAAVIPVDGPKSKGGRRPSGRESTATVLLLLATMTEQWLRRYDLVWGNTKQGPFAVKQRENVPGVARERALRCLQRIEKLVPNLAGLVLQLSVSEPASKKEENESARMKEQEHC